MTSKSLYNPYEDPDLHTTVPERENRIDARDGFNDIIRHADIIMGHQFPKQMGQYPRRFRKTIRWGIAAYVVTLAASFIYTFVDSLLG